MVNQKKCLVLWQYLNIYMYVIRHTMNKVMWFKQLVAIKMLFFVTLNTFDRFFNVDMIFKLYLKTFVPENIWMKLKRMLVVWMLNMHSFRENCSDSVFSHLSWAPVTWFRHLIRTLPEHAPLDLLWERSNWEEIALRHLNQTQSENDSGAHREAEERPRRSAAFHSILSTPAKFHCFYASQVSFVCRD